MTGRGQGSRDRVVAIFKGRSKAVPVQKDTHFLEVCRYVVLNPVRAKTVRHPRHWKWSSYGATAGIVLPHGCLMVDVKSSVISVSADPTPRKSIPRRLLCCGELSMQ
jgi:hypothetical protein